MPDNKKVDKVLANNQKGKKQCTACHEEKKLTSFYISKSPLFSIDQRVPVCKECVINSSLNDDGTINEIELNKILRKIDKPYYKDLIESAINQFKREHSYVSEEEIKFHGKELLQNYYRLIAMRQDLSKSYDDSEKDGFIHRTSNTSKKTKIEISNKYSDVNEDIKDDKPVDSDSSTVEELIYSEKWMGEYSKVDLEYLEDYYTSLNKDYNIVTENHRDYAKKIAKASWAMDKAFNEMTNGTPGADVKYKNMKEAFDSLSKSAKFSESTRSVNDVGASSFSKVAAMVESHNWIPEHHPLERDTIDEMIDYLSTITKSL